MGNACVRKEKRFTPHGDIIGEGVQFVRVTLYRQDSGFCKVTLTVQLHEQERIYVRYLTRQECLQADSHTRPADFLNTLMNDGKLWEYSGTLHIRIVTVSFFSSSHIEYTYDDNYHTYRPILPSALSYQQYKRQ